MQQVPIQHATSLNERRGRDCPILVVKISVKGNVLPAKMIAIMCRSYAVQWQDMDFFLQALQENEILGLDLTEEDVVEQFILEHIERGSLVPGSTHRISGKIS